MLPKQISAPANDISSHSRIIKEANLFKHTKRGSDIIHIPAKHASTENQKIGLSYSLGLFRLKKLTKNGIPLRYNLIPRLCIYGAVLRPPGFFFHTYLEPRFPAVAVLVNSFDVLQNGFLVKSTINLLYSHQSIIH